MELILDFLSEEEETELIHFISPQKNKTSVVFTRNKTKLYQYNNNLPKIFTNLIEKVNNFTGNKFTCMQVNEYVQGQGICDHIDSIKYDNIIIILSLMSNVTLRFKNCISKQCEYIELPQRSIFKFYDKYRYDYTHSIQEINNQRVSIVFRTLPN